MDSKQENGTPGKQPAMIGMELLQMARMEFGLEILLHKVLTRR